MKKIYIELQKYFEKITSTATLILSSSITFIVALIVITLWFANRDYKEIHSDEVVRDMIHAVTFLSLFVIQREFNHFSASIQVKLNELILSHKPANNAVINVEKKTEHQIIEIQEHYAEVLNKDNKELAEMETKIEEIITKK